MGTKSGLHRFAVLVVIATILLIFVGGLVTSTGSGLSVPDWPLSYGKILPRMEGGVAYEHGHRMAAALVGLLSVALTAWIWIVERRKWVRWLGAFALLAVICQGVLGGLTVLFKLPPALSIGHAALAEIFLCLNLTIAFVTSSTWETAAPPIMDEKFPQLRLLGTLTTIAIFCQILLGAIVRHTASGLAIPDFPLSYGHLLPPFFNFQIFLNYSHRIAGLAVILLVLWFSLKTLRSRSETSIHRPALMLLLLLACQAVLGAITIWSRKAPLPTTLHVACGAATLGTCFWLTLNAYRAFMPRSLANLKAKSAKGSVTGQHAS
jgi:heme a synthase